MAVIDGLPETKVSIRVNGSEEDCIEYDDPDPPKSASSQGPATHTTSKVIESQVDAGFSIRFESRNRRTWINGKNWLALQLHIDGQFIATYHCGPSALVDQTIVSTIDSFPERSSKPGKEIRRHFNFASIKTGFSSPSLFIDLEPLTLMTQSKGATSNYQEIKSLRNTSALLK